jgi:hypothetical protein
MIGWASDDEVHGGPVQRSDRMLHVGNRNDHRELFRIELLRRSGRASRESPGLSASRRRVGSPRASSSPSALYWLSGETGEETRDQSQRQGDAEHEAELE